MFFKKKTEKDNNIKKKKGCLKPLIISIVIFVVLGFAVIMSVKDVIKIYGVNLKTFQEYVNWLNEEVDENTLTTNKITNAHYVAFTEKANNSGLEIFDSNGNVQMNVPTIKIENSITLTDCELGAMINNASKQENNSQVFNLLELTITDLGNGFYLMKSVVKFDLTEVKKEIGKNANDLPNQIYITSEGSCYTVGSRIQTKDNTIKINQLSNDKNQKIVNFLKEVEKDMEDDELSSIMDINNYVLTEIINSFVSKTNTKIVLSNGTISFNIKN